MHMADPDIGELVGTHASVKPYSPLGTHSTSPLHSGNLKLNDRQALFHICHTTWEDVALETKALVGWKVDGL